MPASKTTPMSKILDESVMLSESGPDLSERPLPSHVFDQEEEDEEEAAKKCTGNVFKILDPEAKHRLKMIIRGEEQVAPVRNIVNWPSSISYRLKSLLGALLTPRLMLQCLKLPRIAFFSIEAAVFLGVVLLPVMVLESVFYPIFRLVFGVLYPAYSSYKAIRTRDVKKYVQWMMYWVVFAFFTCIETFTDIFMSWFPFYYEVKVILVIWLLSPATKGSSTLYRKFVHPMLTRRESEIDEYLSQAKEKSYSTMLELGSKGVTYATSVIMQTAIKGGGNIVQTLRKSYSLSDLSEPDAVQTMLDVDMAVAEVERRPGGRANKQRPISLRSSSTSTNAKEMYVEEVDRAGRRVLAKDSFGYVRSTEDISSSGYSSADAIGPITRQGSVTRNNPLARPRIKAKRTEHYEDEEEKDSVFFANHNRESPEFYELSYPNPLSSARNSLSSISELANDEEVARFMAIDRRGSCQLTEMQDPRFALFCKWLESQKEEVERVKEEERTFESDVDEFHDAEKEQSPPETLKESVEITVIPTITVPPPPTDQPLESKASEQDPIPTASGNSIISNRLSNNDDPVKLMGRRLHSPKKGRAPEPPRSPALFTAIKPEEANQEQKPLAPNLHWETII